jgi:hypothetical protein
VTLRELRRVAFAFQALDADNAGPLAARALIARGKLRWIPALRMAAWPMLPPQLDLPIHR